MQITHDEGWLHAQNRRKNNDIQLVMSRVDYETINSEVYESIIIPCLQ